MSGKNLYYYDSRNIKTSGAHPKLTGDVSELHGNCSKIWGNAQLLLGNVSGLSGDVSRIFGVVTGLSGDVSRVIGDVSFIKGSARKIPAIPSDDKKDKKAKKIFYCIDKRGGWIYGYFIKRQPGHKPSKGDYHVPLPTSSCYSL